MYPNFPKALETSGNKFLIFCLLLSGGSIMMVKQQFFLAVVISAFLLGQAPATLLAADSPNTRQLPGTRPPTPIRGREQPRLHDEMFREFEANLLRMFGMKERPKLDGKPIIPKYMRELYNKHKENDYPNLPTSGRGYLPANTVRSFYHQGKKSPDTLKFFWTLSGFEEAFNAILTRK